MADALSRIEDVSSTPVFTAISTPSCSMISQLQQFFAQHPVGQQLMNKFQNDPSMQQKFSQKSGLLYLGDGIFVTFD